MTNTPEDPRTLTLADLRVMTTLSVEEAARVLGLGRAAGYEAVRRGDIPALRIGGRVRVPAPGLLRLLSAAPEQHEVPADA